MEKETVVNHPAFGKLQISRINGSIGTLVGSPIQHNHFIALRICESELVRSLHHDRYHAGKQIVEIFLSPAQWAEAISSLNTEGVECTINHRMDVGQIEAPPQDNPREQIRQEFKDDMKKVVETFAAQVVQIRELLELKKGKPLNIAERETINKALSSVEMELRSNIPFTHTMFDEAMEKTVLHAKGEILAFVEMTRRCYPALEAPEVPAMGRLTNE